VNCSRSPFKCKDIQALVKKADNPSKISSRCSGRKWMSDGRGECWVLNQDEAHSLADNA